MAFQNGMPCSGDCVSVVYGVWSDVSIFTFLALYHARLLEHGRAKSVWTVRAAGYVKKSYL